VNDNEQKQIKLSWAFVLFGTLLGFFFNLAASSMFDLYINSYKPKVLALLVFSLLISFFIIGFLSYIFENIGMLMEKYNFWELILKYVKSWWKRK